MNLFKLSLLTLFLLFFSPAKVVGTGIPVVDVSNLTQTIITAIENVEQTLVQIEQTSNLILQYENMIKNTIAPAAYIWDRSTNLINRVVGLTDTIANYKNSFGSVDKYLSKFQDIGYYRSSPCFSKNGCTEADKDVIDGIDLLASEAQKLSNDALVRLLEDQQNALSADAATLESLQSNAQSATGRMQALQYANQLSAQQANQLLQLRALLIAQNNAYVARQQAIADKEARHKAADDLFYESRFEPSSGTDW
ncbi:MAG: P-type conjugative transfer protein TrbJ [Oceanicoccus sp.]|uniref:P-type conjugative transfer protein TrbJ n=1 Tax=Oceanicoccus sp. TaxID=2691044 RepID=UPI00262F7122|nr:P-type conjugative transfer protein TrbJ [Oceanicoccus sp.]MCP3908444.1 P-type conjugative transfer protein TrbJ [Oceanicoccus sp.]